MFALKKWLVGSVAVAGFGFLAGAIPAAAADPPARVRSADERPAKVDLWPAQTPLKDQGRRGYCIAHSSVAALEAAYKRAGYGDLDLSEEFLLQVAKLTYLEGGLPPGMPRALWGEPLSFRSAAATENKPTFSEGGYGAGYVHLLAAGAAVPAEGVMPYREAAAVNRKDPRWKNQFDVGSYNLDPRRLNTARLSRATFYGVKSFENVKGNDPDAIEAALAAGREVVWDYFHPISAVGGSPDWVVVPWQKFPIGGHSVLIVGYDRTDPAHPWFLVKNSWDGVGRVRVSYDFVRTFGWEMATTITAVTEPREWPELAGLGRWYAEVGGQKGVLDLYHIPGVGRVNFRYFGERGEDGRVRADRRVGTFFVDGDPAKAFRVNGAIHPDGVSLVIDWANPTLPYDHEGPAVRLTFAGGTRDRMAGDGAWAVRLTSPEAFAAKVAVAELPEVKSAE